MLSHPASYVYNVLIAWKFKVLCAIKIWFRRLIAPLYCLRFEGIESLIWGLILWLNVKTVERVLTPFFGRLNCKVLFAGLRYLLTETGRPCSLEGQLIYASINIILSLALSYYFQDHMWCDVCTITWSSLLCNYIAESKSWFLSMSLLTHKLVLLPLLKPLFVDY